VRVVVDADLALDVDTIDELRHPRARAALAGLSSLFDQDPV
jgi:hypothetical protein